MTAPSLFDLVTEPDRHPPQTYACPACRARVTMHVPLSCPPSCSGAGRHPTRVMREEPPK